MSDRGSNKHFEFAREVAKPDCLSQLMVAVCCATGLPLSIKSLLQLAGQPVLRTTTRLGLGEDKGNAQLATSSDVNFVKIFKSLPCKLDRFANCLKVVPSYILVGDQSCGKTSLLSRLARMPLGYTANKTGTCPDRIGVSRTANLKDSKQLAMKACSWDLEMVSHVCF